MYNTTNHKAFGWLGGLMLFLVIAGFSNEALAQQYWYIRNNGTGAVAPQATVNPGDGAFINPIDDSNLQAAVTAATSGAIFYLDSDDTGLAGTTVTVSGKEITFRNWNPAIGGGESNTNIQIVTTERDVTGTEVFDDLVVNNGGIVNIEQTAHFGSPGGTFTLEVEDDLDIAAGGANTVQGSGTLFVSSTAGGTNSITMGADDKLQPATLNTDGSGLFNAVDVNGQLRVGGGTTPTVWTHVGTLDTDGNDVFVLSNTTFNHNGFVASSGGPTDFRFVGTGITFNQTGGTFSGTTQTIFVGDGVTTTVVGLGTNVDVAQSPMTITANGTLNMGQFDLTVDSGTGTLVNDGTLNGTPGVGNEPIVNADLDNNGQVTGTVVVNGDVDNSVAQTNGTIIVDGNHTISATAAFDNLTVRGGSATAATNITVDNGTLTIPVSGTLAMGGNTLFFTGTSQAIVNGERSGTQPVTVSTGTTSLSGIGLYNGLQVNAGATGNLASNINSGPFQNNGSVGLAGFTSTGAFTNNGTITSDGGIAGPLTMTAAGNINPAATVTVSGDFTNNRTTPYTGTVVVDAFLANRTVNEGVANAQFGNLVIESQGANNDVFFAGGDLVPDFFGNLTVRNGAEIGNGAATTLRTNAGTNFVNNGTVSENVQIVGATNLSGTGNFAGAIDNNSTATLTSNVNYTSGTAFDNTGGTLSLNGNTFTGNVNSSGGTISTTGRINGDYQLGTITAGQTVTVAGNVDDNTGQAVSGTLIIDGAAVTRELGGTNRDPGAAITVTGANGVRLVDGNFRFYADVVVDNGSKLDLNGQQVAFQPGVNLTANGSGQVLGNTTLTFDGNSTVTLPNGFAGTIDSNGGTQNLNINTDGGNADLTALNFTVAGGCGTIVLQRDLAVGSVNKDCGGLVVAPYDLYVTGNFNNAGGSVVVAGTTIFIGGNFNNVVGYTGEVVLNGAAAQAITGNGQYDILTLSGTGPYNVGNNITNMIGNLTINSGDLALGAFEMYVGGTNITLNGTGRWTTTTGNLAASNDATTAGSPFTLVQNNTLQNGNFLVNEESVGPVPPPCSTINDTYVRATTDVKIQTLTVECHTAFDASTVTLTANTINNQGTYLSGSTFLVFTNGQTICPTPGAGNLFQSQLSIEVDAGVGGTVLLGCDIVLTRSNTTFRLKSGTLNMQDFDITLFGDFEYDGGTLFSGNNRQGVLRFVGTNPATSLLVPDGGTFFLDNLVVDRPGGTLALEDELINGTFANIYVRRAFDLKNGTIQANDVNIIYGDTDNGLDTAPVVAGGVNESGFVNANAAGNFTVNALNFGGDIIGQGAFVMANQDVNITTTPSSGAGNLNIQFDHDSPRTNVVTVPTIGNNATNLLGETTLPGVPASNGVLTFTQLTTIRGNAEIDGDDVNFTLGVNVQGDLMVFNNNNTQLELIGTIGAGANAGRRFENVSKSTVVDGTFDIIPDGGRADIVMGHNLVLDGNANLNGGADWYFFLNGDNTQRMASDNRVSLVFRGGKLGNADQIVTFSGVAHGIARVTVNNPRDVEFIAPLGDFISINDLNLMDGVLTTNGHLAADAHRGNLGYDFYYNDVMPGNVLTPVTETIASVVRRNRTATMHGELDRGTSDLAYYDFDGRPDEVLYYGTTRIFTADELPGKPLDGTNELAIMRIDMSKTTPNAVVTLDKPVTIKNTKLYEVRERFEMIGGEFSLGSATLTFGNGMLYQQEDAEFNPGPITPEYGDNVFWEQINAQGALGTIDLLYTSTKDRKTRIEWPHSPGGIYGWSQYAGRVNDVLIFTQPNIRVILRSSTDAANAKTEGDLDFRATGNTQVVQGMLDVNGNRLEQGQNLYVDFFDAAGVSDNGPVNPNANLWANEIAAMNAASDNGRGDIVDGTGDVLAMDKKGNITFYADSGVSTVLVAVQRPQVSGIDPATVKGQNANPVDADRIVKLPTIVAESDVDFNTNRALAITSIGDPRQTESRIWMRSYEQYSATETATDVRILASVDTSSCRLGRVQLPTPNPPYPTSTGNVEQFYVAHSFLLHAGDFFAQNTRDLSIGLIDAGNGTTAESSMGWYRQVDGTYFGGGDCTVKSVYGEFYVSDADSPLAEASAQTNAPGAAEVSATRRARYILDEGTTRLFDNVYFLGEGDVIAGPEMQRGLRGLFVFAGNIPGRDRQPINETRVFQQRQHPDAYLNDVQMNGDQGVLLTTDMWMNDSGIIDFTLGRINGANYTYAVRILNPDASDVSFRDSETLVLGAVRNGNNLSFVSRGFVIRAVNEEGVYNYPVGTAGITANGNDIGYFQPLRMIFSAQQGQTRFTTVSVQNRRDELGDEGLPVLSTEDELILDVLSQMQWQVSFDRVPALEPDIQVRARGLQDANVPLFQNLDDATLDLLRIVHRPVDAGNFPYKQLGTPIPGEPWRIAGVFDDEPSNIDGDPSSDNDFVNGAPTINTEGVRGWEDYPSWVFAVAGDTRYAPIAPGGERALVQVIHNSPDAPDVDVYLNGSFVDQLTYSRTGNKATRFRNVPVSGTVKVFVAGADTSTATPVLTSSYTLNPDEAAIIVATGTVATTDNFPLQLLVKRNARREASTMGRVDFFIGHTAPGAPIVDVRLLDDTNNNTVVKLLENNIAYGTLGSYQFIAPGSYNIQVTNADNTQEVGVFRFNLSAYEDEAITLLACGRVGTDFGLIGVDSDGNIIVPDVVTDTDEPVAGLPQEFALKGNYPNPFNPTTTISFDLPETAEVKIEVFDVLGRRVMEVPTQQLAAGADRKVELNASNLASGTYLYRVVMKTAKATKIESGRMTLIK